MEFRRVLFRSIDVRLNIEIGKLADAEAGESRVGDGRAAIHAQGPLRTKIDEFIIHDEVPDVRGPLDTGMILEIIDVREKAVLPQIIRCRDQIKLSRPYPSTNQSRIREMAGAAAHTDITRAEIN